MLCLSTLWVERLDVLTALESSCSAVACSVGGDVSRPEENVPQDLAFK